MIKYIDIDQLAKETKDLGFPAQVGALLAELNNKLNEIIKVVNTLETGNKHGRKQ